MSTDTLEPTKVVAPPHLEGEMAKTWVDNTEKHGVPVYKYPFWFWDNDLQFGDPDVRTYCNPFGDRDSADIYACSVWNNKSVEKLGWFSAAPLYMEDHRAPTVPSDMEVIHNEETSPDQKKRAENKAAILQSGLPLIYLIAGFAGAAILYKAYQKKK